VKEEQGRQPTREEATRNADLAKAHAEIKAMSDAYDALRHLDGSARQRAMRWLGDRLRVADDPWTQEEPPF